MSTKVYCEDCKWFSSYITTSEEIELEYTDCCAPKNINFHDSWRRKEPIKIFRRNPKDINKSNDCDWFIIRP